MVMANTGIWTELIFLFLITFHLLLSAQAAPANFWWLDDPAYDLDFVYDFGGNLGFFHSQIYAGKREKDKTKTHIFSVLYNEYKAGDNL